MPSQGCTFQKWTGDVDGVADTDNSTITVVMSRDRVITVNFTAPEGSYNVTVEASPAAGGFVTVETACGSQTSDNAQPVVSAECLPGSDVTLLAEPAEGYRFSGWNGDLRSHHDNVTLTVDSSKNIIARFAKAVPFPCHWVIFGVGVLIAATAVLVGVMRRQPKGRGDGQRRVKAG